MGCRAERAGIQSNMHREITIAPLGDLQMLAVQGVVVGSYRSSNISWETAKQNIQPTNLLSLSFFRLISLSASISLSPSSPLSEKFEPPLAHMHDGNTKKVAFQTEEKCLFLSLGYKPCFTVHRIVRKKDFLVFFWSLVLCKLLSHNIYSSIDDLTVAVLFILSISPAFCQDVPLK